MKNNKHHDFSPSQLQYIELCPGRVRMCAQCAEPDEETPDSSEGTFLHGVVASVLAGGDMPELSAEHEDLVRYIYDFAANEVKEKNITKHFIENEFLVFDENRNTLTYGTPDYVCVSDEEAYVFDWKFGRNSTVEPEFNLQLKTYALAVHQRFGVKTVKTYIVQPRCSVKHTSFTFSNFPPIIKHISKIIERAKQPELVLNPGELQCTYCRARSFCPAAIETLKQLPQKIDEKTDITPQRMSELLEATVLAEKMCEAIKTRARELMENGVVIPGWTLAPGAKTRNITDVNAAYEAAVTMGVTAEEFIACCKISVTQLEKIATKKIAESQQKTATEAKKIFNDRMSGVTEVKESSKRMIRL